MRTQFLQANIPTNHILGHHEEWAVYAMIRGHDEIAVGIHFFIWKGFGTTNLRYRLRFLAGGINDMVATWYTTQDLEARLLGCPIAVGTCCSLLTLYGDPTCVKA